jgi:hypothetical protein
MVTELQRLAEVKWARLEKEEVVQGLKPWTKDDSSFVHG